MKRDVDFLKQNIIAHRGDFGEIEKFSFTWLC